MKIAFLIQSHQYNQQFERLCQRLSEYPVHQSFVHHDFSQSQLPQETITQFNLSVVHPHRPTAWSDISQTLAEIDLIEHAYRNAPDADWFILLSAACYPIKSPQYIASFLEKAAFDGYINLHPCDPQQSELAKNWHRKMFSRPMGHVPFISKKGQFYWREIRIPRLQTPFNSRFRFYFGANWFILSRKVIAYLVNLSLHKHPILNFYRQAKGVGASDEVLLNSILGNTRDFNLSSDYHRYIDWEGAVDWHPNVLTERHFQDISASHALFARKFDPIKSQTLLNKIDQHLLYC